VKYDEWEKTVPEIIKADSLWQVEEGIEYE